MAALGRYHRGEFLMVVPAPFGPFGAIVAWANDGQLGLEFTPPLHLAVVNHIMGLKAPECPIEQRWRQPEI